jgi:hypothetical protein
MKHSAILSFFLLFQIVLLGQHNQLKGIWYSADQEVMVIEDTSGRLENIMQRGDDFSSIKISKKTISFLKQYYSSATDYKVLYTDNFNFKILSLNDSILEVEPNSTYSKDYFLNRGKIKFVKKEYWKTKQLDISKIIFHSSQCFGSCPEIDIQIDADKTVKYKLYGYAVEKSKQGHFTGQMSDSVYETFLSILKNCQIESLRWNSTVCCDGAVVTLIFYFNKERKYLKSMLPSTLTEDLLNFFYTIESKVEFKRTGQKFYMEE